MLFGSEEKWWGTGGKRKQPHEGIDLYSYQDDSGEECRLDENTLVPVIYKSEVLRITDDFLGQSIFMGHDLFFGKKRLFTVFGHLRLDKQIKKGTVLERGSVAGHLAKTSLSSHVPEHLHISIAVIPESPSYEHLDWKILRDEKEVLLLDPLPVISA